jgi:hypothetical protein
VVLPDSMVPVVVFELLINDQYVPEILIATGKDL